MSSGVAKGAVGTIAPCRTGQRRKILLDQWFMLLNLIKIKIVLLREAICGLEYAENAFAGRPHWGSSRRSPDLLVGWEGTHLPRPHTTRRLRRSVCPLHIISGYATGRKGTETEDRGGEVRLPHSEFMDPPVILPQYYHLSLIHI